MSFSILDCTLRDGGYYTNWDFDPHLVKQYIQTLGDLPVEYVEVGYRNPPTHSSYFGEYYYLPLSTLKMVDELVDSKLKIAAMLDTKACKPEDVAGLLKGCQGIVDLIRLTVAPAELNHGVAIASAVKKLGFKVGFNLMYLSKIEDLEAILKPLAALDDGIDYVYLVDSFGGCLPSDVRKAFSLAKSYLPQKIGFHGHDNVNLAFANSLAALEGGADMLDATVLGMGRGAGNLRTELILAYLGQVEEDNSVDLSNMADLLQVFQAMKDEYRWGSELPYIVSGFSNLPQKDVMEWLGKRRYSTSTIVETLQGKHTNSATSEQYSTLLSAVEELGLSGCDTCVIVGGGSSAKQHQRAIVDLVKQYGWTLIHSSLKNIESFASVDAPQVLCLPGRELEKLKGLPSARLNHQFNAYVLPDSRLMQSSVPKHLFSRVVTVQPIARKTVSSNAQPLGQESPLGIALSAAKDLNIQTIYLVGFDGYPQGSQVQREMAQEVQETIDLFTEMNPGTQIISLTPTRYSVQQDSVYSALRA